MLALVGVIALLYGAEAINGALCGCGSGSGVGYPREGVEGDGVAVTEARASVMDAGLGRMVGRRGEVLLVFPAFMMLGICTLFGEVGP